MKKLISFCAIFAASVALHGDTAGLAFDTGSFEIKNLDNTTLLSGGSDAAGDGFVVEFGFYSSGTAVDNFAGSWTAITGASSLNSAFSASSIGDIIDNGAGDGTFADAFVFDTAIPSTSAALPTAGQVMAVRFYNAASIAAATHYATASNDTWTWIAPATPQSNMAWSLDNVGTIWQGGFIAYTGNMISVVPEPASLAVLLGAAAVGISGLRRRRVVR